MDWNTAVATGTRLLRSGPEVPRDEAERAVRDLRRFSTEAEAHVREITGLGHELPVLEGAVLDRPDWVRAAAQGLNELTGTASAIAETRGASQDRLLSGWSARSAGVQTGVVLAYLGGKVLGQFDPFGQSGVPGQHGRLMLVAPNVVAAERALAVPVEEFRMWVCLHESTHRLQFNAVPWLREHFATSLGELLSEMTDSAPEVLGRLPTAVRELRSGRHAAGSSPGMLGVLEVLQTPQQRAVLDRIIALSTLLEGHADHVMDAVGPRVIPSVATIRERFTRRREGGGVLDRVLRSLLGMDAKVQQYARGAEFTRSVVGRVGMEGFNAVWQRPENLPTRAEIAAPEQWIARVHG